MYQIMPEQYEVKDDVGMDVKNPSNVISGINQKGKAVFCFQFEGEEENEVPIFTTNGGDFSIHFNDNNPGLDRYGELTLTSKTGKKVQMFMKRI